MGVRVGNIVIMLDREQDEEVKCMNWIEENRPHNTKRSYGRYFNEFVEYSQRVGIDHRSPVAVASFMKYAVSERPRRLGRDTVTSIIPSAIAAGLRYTDSSALQNPLVVEMKKAVRRTVPKPNRAKDPLTPDMLRQMAERVNVADLEQTRNYFMVLLMTFAMLRESEVVMLQLDDLWIHEEEDTPSLHVYIGWSKTDQPADGHTVVLAEMEDYLLCPLIWFTAYSNIRDPTQEEYFFYGLGKTAKPLSEKTPNHIVKKLVKDLGLDDSSFGSSTGVRIDQVVGRSHSCRRGGCTAAIEAGVDLRNVARHGRWKSNAINTYIVDSRQTKLSVSKAIAGEHNQ